jgi:glycosyltransferase involved in cell wall biosynthesis
MIKPTLHLIGIFHTIHNQEFSHCAFTGKALRFPEMMQVQGFPVVEYSNEGSESAAHEKVVMLRAEEFDELLGNREDTKFHGDTATVGSRHHTLFEQRLIEEMKRRVQPGDLICHPFGHAHQRVLSEFPKNIHIETGIGYSTTMPSAIHIFESYAWRHYHAGKDKRQGNNYEWVIPNYFDLTQWDVSEAPGEYYAFLGRIDACKGLDTLFEIAKNLPIDGPKIVLCGQGNPDRWRHEMIEYRGPLKGRARSEFLGRAICSLMPTKFIEPFGGSGVEGMLCGTPLISVDYGAFTETVMCGFTGYRCRTLQHWMDALPAAAHLNRLEIANYARATYSLETCGGLYTEAFETIHGLYGKGWYTLR